MKKILCLGILGLALTACSGNGSKASVEVIDSSAIEPFEVVDSTIADTTTVDTICVD